MEAQIFESHAIDLTDLGEGVSRRILAWNPDMMMVEVHFEPGGVGALHAHPHVQCTYVLSGRFRFTLDGREAEVAAGDTLSIPGNLPHGTLCLEKGVLLDVFTPMRKDFLA